jgi:hypothetical protein
MLNEVVVETQKKVKEVNLQIGKMNQLNEDKTKLISLQAAQILDLNKLNGFAEQNIIALKYEVSLQKKKKFRTFVLTAAGTALITSTGILILKP